MQRSTKIAFDKRSSLSTKNNRHKYSLLQKLPIEFITPINCGGKVDDHDYEPLTDSLGAPFRYNNTNQLLSGKVRRNEKYHDSVMLKQRSIIDLSDLVMVSKMHILGLPANQVLNVYTSEFPHDSYQKVSIKQTVKHNQNLRVIDFGNVPARFLMVEVVNGEPLPNDESAVEVYGIHYRNMDEVLGEGETKLLFEKTYQILYGFNTQKRKV